MSSKASLFDYNSQEVMLLKNILAVSSSSFFLFRKNRQEESHIQKIVSPCFPPLDTIY